ncbi:hypothetical protein [Helicobacter turcicus]|uniref:Uncharacterized protein n=1 Tax=Helicobacter turcicus TaxID=2867412 RepID=A0ABS7JKS2_9HELI|nr:hypothetical protein [Helicobacter turcicus]MBX7489984.1 hypothetical protein [Helicobacter turcicus]MBX7544843.1 hypothetical protein [Helicobacter turcicus]
MQIYTISSIDSINHFLVLPLLQVCEPTNSIFPFLSFTKIESALLTAPTFTKNKSSKAML